MAFQSARVNTSLDWNLHALATTRVGHSIWIKFRIGYLRTETFIFWQFFSVGVITLGAAPVKIFLVFTFVSINRIFGNPSMNATKVEWTIALNARPKLGIFLYAIETNRAFNFTPLESILQNLTKLRTRDMTQIFYLFNFFIIIIIFKIIHTCFS